MRRIFWLVLGATAGVLLVRKLTKTAQSLTPRGLASSMGGIGDTLRGFFDDVRVAMTEREGELLDALGVNSASDANPASAAGSEAGGGVAGGGQAR